MNVVAPSAILTDRSRTLMTEDQQGEVTAAHLLGRLGTHEDAALATLFLASEGAAWLTGLTIDVTGGRISL